MKTRTNKSQSSMPYETYSFLMATMYGTLFMGGMMSLPYVMPFVKILVDML